jgi:hypothetical protein
MFGRGRARRPAGDDEVVGGREVVAVGVPGDVAAVRRAEMRRQQQRVAVAAVVEDRAARRARLRRLLAEAAVPVGPEDLHRLVQRIARKDRRVVARFELEHAVAGGVAEGVLEEEALDDLRAVVDELDLAGLDHRHDAVLDDGDVLRQRQVAAGRRLPVLELAAREDVLGVREGRHPLAVDQPRVPADVVDVQVRADHQRHVLRLHAGLGQAIEVGQAQLVEALEQRQGARLVVAAAGVDQDRVAIVADHPGVHAGHDLLARLVPEARVGEQLVLGEDLGAVVGKQEGRLEPRRQHLLDARHVIRTHLECRHSFSRLQRLRRW